MTAVDVAITQGCRVTFRDPLTLFDTLTILTATGRFSVSEVTSPDVGMAEQSGIRHASPLLF